MEKSFSYSTDFREILQWGFLLIFVGTSQVRLQSDEMNRHVYEDMPTLMLTYRHSRDKYKKYGIARETEEAVADKT